MSNMYIPELDLIRTSILRDITKIRKKLSNSEENYPTMSRTFILRNKNVERSLTYW